ncbi:MAG: hypothetical protein Unbinned3992contig1000_15 [Prokaryotic dsDNA virus sp.]|nr:MAG: hypothetical protein Unbinned3992contig1000_15 [Prokaryotic dsDNA virus sp.]|tara:strand:+ start:4434 stop:4838 length:405 start_codon:yes stop_codon:yes gene_type:complete
MAKTDEVVGRLTHSLKLMINNQNHNRATYGDLPDCPLSYQAANAMAYDVWQTEIALVDNGRVVVAKERIATSALAQRLRDHFEIAAEDILHRDDIPMWITSLAAAAVYNVDYQELALGLIGSIDEIIADVEGWK